MAHHCTVTVIRYTLAIGSDFDTSVTYATGWTTDRPGFKKIVCHVKTASGIPAFSSVVRQMPGFITRKDGT
jgi:hypothetical protein